MQHGLRELLNNAIREFVEELVCVVSLRVLTTVTYSIFAIHGSCRHLFGHSSSLHSQVERCAVVHSALKSATSVYAQGHHHLCWSCAQVNAKAATAPPISVRLICSIPTLFINYCAVPHAIFACIRSRRLCHDPCSSHLCGLSEVFWGSSTALEWVKTQFKPCHRPQRRRRDQSRHA